MKNKWISLKQLGMHDVHTMIRLVQKGSITWSERSEIYTKIQSRTIATLLKLTGPALLGYLIATSLRSGDKILLKLSSFEASLPASYFLLALSVIFLFLLIALNSVSVAMSLKSSIAGKILIPGFSIVGYEAIQGRDEIALGLPTPPFSYWKDVLRLTALANGLLITVFLSLLLPFFAFGAYLFHEQFLIFLDQGSLPIERITSGFGLLSVSTGFLSLLIFHVPIPLSKNTNYVRWGFLWKLQKQPSDAERKKRWLSTDDANK